MNPVPPGCSLRAQCAHGAGDSRRIRWHRRLQGVRALPILVRDGHDVTPLLTPEAEGFVSAKTFEALARSEMPRELYPHLVEADLLVLAPLTANTLAKLANGLADNVLTQAVLAFRGPCSLRLR